jgi:hypothetical protein
MKFTAILALFFIAFSANAQTYNGPESAEFDVANNRWLIGNTSSHQILARDSAGTLSILVSGIGSGPYGIEIVGDTVFCCSGGSIKGYLLSNGQQVFNLNLGATFLNGLTHDDSGNLYTTDFSAKTIHKVSIAGQTDSIIASGLVKTPNGIVYDAANNRCVYVTWGSNAPINAIDLSTYAVTTIIPTTLSSCDGVTRDGQGRYYVSAWGSQSIVRFDSNFVAPPTTVGTSMSNPADIFYDVTNDVLAVPNSGNNTVTFLNFNTVSVNEISTFNSTVYPNPATDHVTIDLIDGNIQEVVVYNAIGKLVFQTNPTEFSKTYKVDISKFESGKYFYQIKNEKGLKSSGSFIVN